MTIVTCSVQEGLAGTTTLRVHYMESVVAASVTVRVLSDDGTAAHTGTLHCTVIHD